LQTKAADFRHLDFMILNLSSPWNSA